MPDELDNEALAYMQQRSPNFNESRGLTYQPSPFGGKVRTKPSRRGLQRSQNSYISDEPERFEKYIDDIKDQFRTPDQARDMIINKWARDSSLKNLLEGMEKKGVLERELNALLNTPKIKRSFGFIKVAKRLRISPKTFRSRYLPLISEQKIAQAAERIERDRRYKPELTDLVRTEVDGTIRGTATRGRAATIKRNNKTILVYRDAKGRFVKR